MLSLPEKHRYKNNTKENWELTIDDVVLTKDDKITPSNNWKGEK